jgi:predicted dehydrogenase
MTTIAIIGQGYMGKTHAEAWTRLGLGGQIKYINAPGERTLFAPAEGARFVGDLDTVLDDTEVDVVSVCTPTPTHADIAIRALRAGKHVLLEKPIALNLDDALAIRDAAASSDRVLMVAQVVRFFAGYVLLREAWQDDRIGKLLSVRAVRALNTPTWADWWADEAQSGGVPVDFSIHDYDQANLFLGVPIAVTATRSFDDGPIETTTEYRDGGIGQVLSHAHTPVGVPFTSSLELLGTGGLASYRLSAGSPTEPTDSGESTFRLASATESEARDVPDNEPYARETEYFLQCVALGAQPELSSTDSAVRALEVSLAARQSLRTGRRVLIESRADE